MAKRTGNPKVLAIVLAGGEGKRLMPLTADRAKPAVPFGGIYRLIDFALSNIVNSGYLKIVVLRSTSPTAWTVTSPRRGGCRRCSATT
jgi:glucose-1-phosphate adenylyltransferase